MTKSTKHWAKRLTVDLLHPRHCSSYYEHAFCEVCKRTCCADDDVKTAETLRRIAKGFYSMGVEVPNWQYLKVSYNRDEEYIRNELFGDTIRMQF